MEDEYYFNVPLPTVKSELRRGIVECQKRGLLHSTKWLAEMNHGINDVEVNSNDLNKPFGDTSVLDGIDVNEYDNYFLAKSYFDVREYDRAADFVRDCESPVPRFLHLYSMYMARDKRRLDSITDQTNLNDSGYVRDLAELLATLRTENARGRLDGYGMYLYGVVLKALNLNQAAIEMLQQSIEKVPMLWSAYLELAPLISEKEKLQQITLGGHWMRHFFIAHTYIELYLNDEALKVYQVLQTAGFSQCVYVMSQVAMAYHFKRDVNKAISLFQALQDKDPFSLDNMDTYSNLLFVKELKTEMAQLAHKAVGINKYRPETCCIIGNYYSIRCDHQKAILYFQRALKLNPKYLAAWTLMGHEFMELKNTNAAIQSYRKAVEVNKRDYRAWYGLGQSYEILKMHYYSLYYFKISHKLRPYDSRMLVALGETYEKLDKTANAIRCYWKACDVGDIEGIALYKLANLHEKLGDYENAVQCYGLYCEDERAATDKQSLYHGFITLANYYEAKGDYNQAMHYAYKCLESDDRKSEAKSLLKTIENKRSGKAYVPSKTSSSTITVEVSGAAGTATATALPDVSSDDDMEIEISDYHYLGFPGMSTAVNETIAAERSSTGQADAAPKTPADNDDMTISINESILPTPSTTSNTSLVRERRTFEASTSAAAAKAMLLELRQNANVEDSDDDDEDSQLQQSMEISTISLD